ncbi:MAG: family of calcium-binding protein [Acidobacteria bacterium]|nr:family of calcium-binding protein [Acidobacteriota bacterium]
MSTLEDTVIPISLKARDGDGDPLVYSIGTLPAKGVLAGTPPDLAYIPNANTTGLDRFTFRVSDGPLASALEVVSVLVIPVNDAPVAESQFLSLSEDASVEILLGARDADNDPLSFVIASAPSKGSISGAAPRLTYRPEAGFNGLDSFTFKVSDGSAESLPATITLAIRSINDPPVAYDQFVALAEDSSQGLLLTGHDPEGGWLAFQIVEPPKNGSVNGAPPNLTYTPARDFHGEDRFTFKVSDGDLESAPAAVRVSVRPVNDAPVPENQFLTVTQGRSRIVTLTGNDAEAGPLQFMLASLPAKGLLSGKPPNLIYLPYPNERGLDSFSFKVSDGVLESAPGTVQLALTEKTSGPTISTIADQTSRNGEPTAKLPFTIGDLETAPEKLVVAASSSMPALVPSENIVLEGSGPARTVRVNPASAQPGTATITVVVWDEDGLAATPAIELITPGDFSVVDPATPLVVEAKATDPDGAIQRIDFYAGATRIGSSTAAPYQFTWSPPSPGRHALSAKAIDNRAGESASSPVNIRVEQPAGQVAVITSGDDPDLGLIRRYLFDLPVQWRLIPRAEARLENLLRQREAVVWHQPGAAEVVSQDLILLESLAKAGTPIYFLGDALLAASRRLSSGERDRWQNLIHLKPGGTSWLKQVAILEAASHPAVLNGPAGAVARFAYPVTAQQSGLQTGQPGEVVLGRSGTFDLLLSAVDGQSSARAFTHHLRLSGATDEFGATEQAKLFKNAIGWLLAKPSFPDLSTNAELPTATVVVDAPAAPPRLVIRRENPDSIRVELPGAGAGAIYALEASDDLIHWSRLNTKLTGPGASATFSWAAAPRRFFRAVSPNAPTISP